MFQFTGSSHKRRERIDHKSEDVFRIQTTTILGIVIMDRVKRVGRGLMLDGKKE